MPYYKMNSAIDEVDSRSRDPTTLLKMMPHINDQCIMITDSIDSLLYFKITFLIYGSIDIVHCSSYSDHR